MGVNSYFRIKQLVARFDAHCRKIKNDNKIDYRIKDTSDISFCLLGTMDKLLYSINRCFDYIVKCGAKNILVKFDTKSYDASFCCVKIEFIENGNTLIGVIRDSIVGRYFLSKEGIINFYKDERNNNHICIDMLLKLRYTVKNEAESEDSNEDVNVIPLENKRVMLVKDSELAGCVNYFANFKALTCCVPNGFDAMRNYSKNSKYDYIFIDKAIPVVSAYETAAAIRSMARKNKQQVKLYLLVDNKRGLNNRRLKEAGFDGVFVCNSHIQMR